jgi:hypothetical protein
MCLKWSTAYVKYYNPSEHLAVNEAINLFKKKVVFKQHIKKSCAIKIFKLCDLTGCTYDVKVCLGEE